MRGCVLAWLVVVVASGAGAGSPALAVVALAWGARRGLRGGAGAGALLGAVYVSAHVVQGLVLDVLRRLRLSLRNDLMRFAMQRGLDQD